LNKPGKKNVRRAVQIFFFLLIGAIAVNKTLAETGYGIPLLSTASLHALCPFGGVVTLYNMATLGTFVQKIHMSAVVLMGIVFVLAILFGPVFCGWVCPLGSVQEWIGKLGRKMLGTRYNRLIPERPNRWLSYLRYVVLVWVVYVTARSGYLIFANIDPYNALFTFWSEEAALPSILILVATLVGSLFIERPWCRFLCPYGALLGLFNKVRIFKLRRAPSTCIDCGRCDRVCPMNIDISHKEVISDALCISCLECTSERHCPVPATVSLQTGAIGSIDGTEKAVSKAKILRAPLMAVLILAVFFTGIVTTMALGIWTTESEKKPSRYTEGIAAGEYDPSDIRGSYTFEEVSNLFDIPIPVLYEAFGLPASADPAVTQTKLLEALYGEIHGPDGPVEIGNEAVQVFVALYKGLPVTLVDTWLPTPAVDLLLSANPDLTDEQLAYLSTHNVALPILDESAVTEENAAPDGDTTAPVLEESTEPLVNGNTTFQQLLDLDLTTTQLEEIFGPELPPSNMKVKDYCTQQGLAFSSVKAQLTELLTETP
jgi:hypothetical protein